METNGYRLLLSEGTLDYFNISDVKESSTEIIIYLEEKNEVPKEYSESKVESKGFYDPITVQDFPIRGKKVSAGKATGYQLLINHTFLF